MGEVTISVEEYKNFLESSVRIKVFADYVKKEKYSIDRDVCGHYLGFEVKDEDGTD